MRTFWNVFPLLLAFSFAACQGQLPNNQSNAGTGSGDSGIGQNNTDDPYASDPAAPCTEDNWQVLQCCPEGKKQCTGTSPDDPNYFCTCSDVWICETSQNPKKCYKETPMPPNGGGGWNCTWSEYKYICTKTYPEGQPETPPGGGSWTCTWSEQEKAYHCYTTTIPNPSNKDLEGGGGWNCEVVENKIECNRGDTSTPTNNPGGGGDWNCSEVEGKKICTNPDANKGLPTPDGSGNWQCNKMLKEGETVWFCTGTSDTPPGGGNWVCEQVEGDTLYKCWKKDESDVDYPSGGGNWACVKGTEFNGTKCEQTENPPQVVDKPGGKCTIGEKMWCDGLDYCGWGQVECDPATNSWKTEELPNGQVVLACHELEGGGRPHTTCACYHTFFNASCCERPDCLVPDEFLNNPQICPASPGCLCDYCNPQKSECKEAGAECIITNSHETFCGRSCDPVNKPCPEGYTCTPLKPKTGSLYQCLPNNSSCYTSNLKPTCL